MKKLIIIATLCLNCNLLTANNKYTVMTNDFLSQEEQYEIITPNKWLDEHEGYARKIAVSFIQKKGFQYSR